MMQNLALLFTILSITSAQDVVVPSDNCQWRGASYGQMNVCEGNEIAIGSCGSGKNDDCGSGDWHQLLCCDMPDYVYSDCVDYKGEHGSELSCPELTNDMGSLVEGACGSGLNHDCEGSTHIVSHRK